MNKLMQRRHDRIKRIVTAYGEEVNGKHQNQFEPVDQTVGDLLTDLMHFCRLADLDFGHLLFRAQDHFTAESGEGDDIEQDARAWAEKTF